MTLTTEQQIQVLQNIDWDYLKRNKEGLCFGINYAYRDIFNKFLPLSEIHTAIPLFTHENAFQFNARKKAYSWWPYNKKGYDLRMRFVNWIISELEKKTNV